MGSWPGCFIHTNGGVMCTQNKEPYNTQQETQCSVISLIKYHAVCIYLGKVSTRLNRNVREIN